MREFPTDNVNSINYYFSFIVLYWSVYKWNRAINIAFCQPKIDFKMSSSSASSPTPSSKFSEYRKLQLPF